MCGRSPAKNLYREDPAKLSNCDCDPIEEICNDPNVNGKMNVDQLSFVAFFVCLFVCFLDWFNL